MKIINRKRETITITIKLKTWKKIMDLKIKKAFRSLDDVIDYLFNQEMKK